MPEHSPAFLLHVHAWSKVLRVKFLASLQLTGQAPKPPRDPARAEALRQSRMARWSGARSLTGRIGIRRKSQDERKFRARRQPKRHRDRSHGVNRRS